MASPLYFVLEGRHIMTTAWTARSLKKKEEEWIEVAYTWGAHEHAYLDNATSTNQIHIPIPFGIFMQHVQDCESSGKIVDCSDKNIPEILKKFQPKPSSLSSAFTAPKR